MDNVSDDRVFAREVRAIVIQALANLIRVPGFWYVIESSSCTHSEDVLSGRDLRTIRIQILTNNRPLLLGQFMDFPVNGLRGYHPNYVFGFIHGYVRAKYGTNLWHDNKLVLDAHEVEGARGSIYRLVPLRDAILEEVLAQASPLAEVMKQYALKYVLTSGSTFSGPSLAMMKCVERLAREKKARSMLDLFCGSGSLSKVARLNGVSRVVCVDQNLDTRALVDNLGAYAEGCEFFETDACGYEPAEPFDLVILDPFYEFALKAVQTIIPRLRGCFGTLLVNLGPPEERFWVSRLLSELRAHALVTTETIAGEIVALCTAMPQHVQLPTEGREPE